MWLYENHPRRNIYSYFELGILNCNCFTLEFAIKFANYYGCHDFEIISCDASAIGVQGYYDRDTICRWHPRQKVRIEKLCRNYKYVTPE